MRSAAAGFGRIWALSSLLCLSVSLRALDAGEIAVHKPEMPNFVIVLADDMGMNCTSVYGGWIQTPQLERLSAQGMTFSDFHSSGIVCSPTRAGLLTGRYQDRVGITDAIKTDPAHPTHDLGLPRSEIVFPSLLRDAGYATAIFGKWHLGYDSSHNPIHYGFDHFRGFLSGNVDYLSHYDAKGVYDWWDGLESVVEEGYSTHLITRHAVQFIEENRSRPFCLYVAHEAVHKPFQAPESPIQRGPDSRPGAVPDASEQDAIYASMMLEMDRGLGEILDALDRLDLRQNTLVFFFSDNGPDHLGGPSTYVHPLRGKKNTVWEGGHRVPAIASWPGQIEAGSTNDDLLISLDLMPTLLDLASVNASHERSLDGRSMTGALFCRSTGSRRQLC